MKITIIHIVLFLVISMVSCSEMMTIQEKTDISKMDLYELAIYINDYVGYAEADHFTQCDVLPIGAKPCGGPWAYLVFSSLHSNEDRLEKLVERYNELDVIRNQKENRLSTCDYATKPKLRIQNGACLGQGYAWNPGNILTFNGLD